ncbi:MAG: Wzz/FepE/Etk N-terminal domain-containing protein [Desulfobacterales bacterium]
MAEKQNTFILYYYLNLVIKRRWLIIIPFCLAMIGGLYYAVTSPKIYEASTLIMVEPQRVPANYVRSIVSSDIESRINTISQQILSRTSLLNIIDQFHLYSWPGAEELFMEEKLDGLRGRINISVRHSRSGNDTFTVSFRDTDPVKSMEITNALASYFIDENLVFREAQATGTNVFLEEELIKTRKRLEEIEVELNDYRKIHMGELPEQLQSNLSILERLQEQHTEKQKTLRDLRATLREIDNQVPQSEYFYKLAQLKEELSNLTLKYTERHPDVIRLKNTIRLMEEKAGASGSEYENAGSASAMAANRFTSLQDISRREVVKEIRDLEEEISYLGNQIFLYHQRVENTPKRELELISLQRDYQNIKESYDSLVQRKLEAEIAVNMEKKQKGEQFRILDTANLPERPISPDIRKIFAKTVLAGLGAGFVLLFLLDFLNPSLKDPKDYESLLGLPVLVTIPKIKGTAEKMRIRVNQAMTFASFIFIAVLVVSFILLSINGVDPTLDFLNRYFDTT